MHIATTENTTLPQYAPIPRATAILGIGRSTLYAEAGRGNIRLIKAGGRTLVDIPHALEWMAKLPLARISPPYRRQS